MHIVERFPREDLQLAHALLGVQQAAYAVEAALIGDDRIPSLHESVEELQAAKLLWLVVSLDGDIVGAVAWSESDDEIDIDRLIVAPPAHRRGIGSTLVSEVMHRAGTRRIMVSTGRENAPARALYERLGFEKVEDEEVLPGLTVTRYQFSGIG